MRVKVTTGLYVDPDEVDSLYEERRPMREIVRGGPHAKDEEVVHHNTQISMKSGAVWLAVGLSADEVETILNMGKEHPHAR